MDNIIGNILRVHCKTSIKVHNIQHTTKASNHISYTVVTSRKMAHEAQLYYKCIKVECSFIKKEFIYALCSFTYNIQGPKVKFYRKIIHEKLNESSFFLFPIKKIMNRIVMH